MPTKEELRQLQALPLYLKIARTQQRIKEWIRHYGVNGVYISFSGGKDSTVLLHIAREMYPEIEAVFVNTGLEYPEIQKFAMSFPNVTVVYPKKTFVQVMKEYGYPLISKVVSHNVGVLRRNPDGKVAHNIFAPEKRGPFAMFKCMFCAFGAHLERGETRFQRLARTHPKQYAFCIGGALTTRQMGCGSLIKMGLDWGTSSTKSIRSMVRIFCGISRWIARRTSDNSKRVVFRHRSTESRA